MKTEHKREIYECLRGVAKMLDQSPYEALNKLKRVVRVIDKNIPYGDGHNLRVSNISIMLGKEIGLSLNNLLVLEVASLLHDLGKLCIDKEILQKRGILTFSERNEIKKHVIKAVLFLAGISEFKRALQGIFSHHEHYDGSGYPLGLSRHEIPLMGRIIAVADAYDAMTSERPYRKARSKKEAIVEILKQSGKQFDPEIVDIFIEVFKENN
jgi:HD-GYP domain-containing protein (c-di-GMP phosphodiesterase class II)